MPTFTGERGSRRKVRRRSIDACQSVSHGRQGNAPGCSQSATCVQHLGDLESSAAYSGTTAEPFLVHRSMAEASFIRSFFARLNYGDMPKDPGPIPIMLQSQLADNGLPTWVPAQVLVLPFSVAEEYLVDHAFSFLDREFHLPNIDSRVSIISGNQSAILALTNCALEKGIVCSSRYAVRLLHVQGRYLTRRWRGILKSTWGATVSDKYSMAEVFGGANYCMTCKSFHFEPIVVPEIVGCATRQPLTTGTGALLL